MAQSEKKYMWIKGKIFKKKDADSPFALETATNGKPVAKFTVRFSKKLDDESYDNKYYNCAAWEETARAIVAECKEKDSVLCEVTKKETDKDGKHYVNYTVYHLFKEVMPDKPQDAWGNQKANAQAPRQSQAQAQQPQSVRADEDFPLDFSELNNPTPENGKEIDIPF